MKALSESTSSAAHEAQAAKTGTRWQRVLTGREIGASPTSFLTAFLPQASSAESIATYAADCETPKQAFTSGNTVCARAGGTLSGSRSIYWVNAAGEVVEIDAISATNPSGTRVVSEAGNWRAYLVDNSEGAARAIAAFSVSDPQRPTVDLSVVKTGDGSVSPGGLAKYQIAATNNGPDAAAGVQLVELTPDNTTYVGHTQDSGPTFTCTQTGSSTICDIASLASGVTATFSFVYQVSASVPVGSVISNNARLTSTTEELHTEDNNWQAKSTVVSAAAGGTETCSLGCGEDVTKAANTTGPNNESGAIVHFSPPSGNDECGLVTTNHCNDCFFPVGQTVVTATASTGETCSFTVTVTGAAGGPSITCPEDKDVNAGANSCAAVVDPGNPTTTPATGLTVEGERSDNQPLDSPYPGGITTITWTATDSQNRSATCQQTITVHTDDQTAPTVVAPDDVTSTTGPNALSCGLIVGETELGTATASDNCGTATVTRTGVPAGNFFPVGVTTITYTAKDGAGNTSTDTQTVTVTDDSMPRITATTANPNPPPAEEDVPMQDVTVHTGSASTSCDAVVSDAMLGNIRARDNCAVTLSRTPTGNTFPVGTTTIVWTATDASGNTTTANQNVTVIDDRPPTITAPADVTAYTGPGRTTCDANVDPGTPSTTDNCAVTVTRSPSGNTFAIGTTTITWTVTDASGNTATDTQDVTVIDNTAPTVTAPADSSASADASCQAAVPNYVAGTTATDNCDSNVTVTQSPAAGTMVGLGPHTVTVTATDHANNSSSDTVIFTVNDTTAPVITCPANIVVYLPVNSSAVSMAVSYPAVTATDNCSTPTITTSKASGSVFLVGPTTVNATATDAAGNSSSCSFTVTVLYNFTGFFSPVGNPPVLNAVNAGRAIPVKFSLSGNKGLGIFPAGSPTSVGFDCGTSSEIDVQETLTAGGSSLSYGGDQYNYVWKTESSWAGTCRQLRITLNDGSVHVANFKFK
jgi:uncharacterized repeat protein (TIGR01451 family)